MLMKLGLSFVVLALAVSGTGCLKGDKCDPMTPASEAASMDAFCLANSILPNIHPSGLYYEIVNPGSGGTASINSAVFITYTGKFLDGTVFDQQTNASLTGWRLGDLIEGWRIGIPLIQKGGTIKLVVPSSLAYGCKGYLAIPANTILYFEITLVNVI